MTWSLAYTQAADTTNGERVHNFMLYFFDTYLSGKSECTVGPGRDSYERTLTITHDDIKGGTSSTHLWYNWTNTSSVTCSQYENEKYAVTPGDNGSISTGNGMGSISAPEAGDWRIWESDEKTDAFLVTKGKVGIYFWPGVGSGGKWNLYRDQAWPAGQENPNTCVGLAIWGSNGLPYCNAPDNVSSSSSASQLYPSVSNVSGTMGNLGADYLFTGVGFNYSRDNYGTTNGQTRSFPCIPGGANDQGVFLPGAGSAYPAYVYLRYAQLVLSTGDSKYYYFMNSSTVTAVFALDFGTTEPDFT